MTRSTVLFLLAFLLVYVSASGHLWQTHELKPVDINRHDGNMTDWIYADLKGDETSYFILSDTKENGVHSLYIEEPKGRVVTQLNSVFPYQGIVVLTDPRDNGRWLFYTYTDQMAVYLNAVKFDWQMPSKRDIKAFARIPRTDVGINNPRIHYSGQIIPQMLEDIDADGRLELLCLGMDGFTSNPRGVYVYDFISGDLKWKFATPCNISGIILRDFDDNGSKELVFGTIALKNTEQVINGLDDFNGWLVVLSVTGEMLHKMMQFNGHGQVYVDIADRGLDNKLEIYTVNSTWGNSGNRNTAEMYSWTGKTMQLKLQLPIASSLERFQYYDYIKRMDAAGTSRIHLVDKSKGLIVLDDNLRIVPHKFRDFTKLIWAVEDLDQDSNKEIILHTADNNLLVLDNHYRVNARLPIPFPEDNAISVHVVKTGLDNNPLISIASAREVYLYEYKHLSIAKFIWDFVKAISLYAMLVLLLLVIFLNYRYSRRLNVMRITANQMHEGLIVLTNTTKIAFASNPVFTLAEGSKDPTCKNLQLCFPSIYEALEKYVATGRDRYVYNDEIGEGSKRQYCKISFAQTRNLRKLLLVTIFPLTSDLSLVADKLRWADIARRLSHHVRRHITNIMLALDVLNSQSDIDKKEYYQIIGSEVEKVRIFTHAFQRFTELKDYELYLQEVVPCIEHCLARSTMPEKIKVIKNWGQEPILAYIEPIRFQEAIANAISNAMDAMPEGGALHISVKAFPKQSSPQEGYNILVEIEDNGMGIPAKYMDEIWKPFFTTKQSGTGIGIPETKKIMDSMQGVFYIQSEEGIGTTVSFWLKGE